MRRRHPEFPIGYLPLDDVVSTPEDFARAVVFEVSQAPRGETGEQTLYLTDEALLATAAALHPGLVHPAEEVLRLIRKGSYGVLLAAVMRFPAAVSATLERPLLLMLDEFQEITRLTSFPATRSPSPP